jgi:hypothetical protein
MYGPAVRYKMDFQDTNVRAASMYQASEVELLARLLSSLISAAVAA